MNLPDLPDEGFCPIAPDLVVEVLSPNESLAAAHEKARRSSGFAFPVRELWG
ncbi:MAG: Uma2 family endonuclease [Armatimonadetes bacterium]|nr:Uma2 family endonuclease [Armatimonadota bacterium]